MDTIVIKIKGLRSAACVSSIEYKLQQLPNMEAVHVDFVTSEALLRSFEKINIEEVKAIVEENGFTMEVSEKASIIRKASKKSNLSLWVTGLSFVLAFVIESVIFFERYSLDLNLVKIAAGLEIALVLLALCFAHKHLANGFKQLVSGVPHMDSLLAVGSFIALVYSAIQANFVFQGYASEYDLYCAAIIGAIFFTMLGKHITSTAERLFEKHKGSSFRLPKGVLLVNDEKHLLPGERLLPGDNILIKEGSIVPVDGIIYDGQGKLDESEITGSFELVSKKKNDFVYAETILKEGSIKVKATATNKNVQAVQLWRMAEKYSKEPKSMQKLKRTDKIAVIFLPIVISLAIIAALSWYFHTGEASIAWKVLVSIMLGSYPCALGFAHSSVLLVINKLANKQGIVFKNAAVMEQLHKITLGVFSCHKDNSNNSMDLVQLTALNLYIDNSLPDFMSDGRVRSVVDLEPKEKAELIQSLRWGGERTLVYGNKISDMPLLACGDVGAAVQNSAAEQFAQVVLPEDNIKIILQAIELSKKLKKAFKRNSIIALFFNLIALPIGVGLWFACGGLLLEPLLLAVVMLLGGVGVLLNCKCLK